MKLKSCFVFLFCSIQCLAQSDSNKELLGLLPKIDILSPIAGLYAKTTELGFSLEKEIGMHTSIELTYQYLFTNDADASFGQYTYTIYESQLIPEFIYYFSSAGEHSGFYAGVQTEVILVHSILNPAPPNSGPNIFPFPPSVTDIHQDGFAIGLDLGFKKYVCKRIVLEILVGDGIGSNMNQRISWTNTQYGRVSLDVGYRF